MSGPTALAFEDRRYSIADLDALAAGMAPALVARGVTAGSRVAVMSSNRPEFVVALRAIWQLGAAAVLLSPAWKQAEVRHALTLTAPCAAVGDHSVLADAMPMHPLDEPVDRRDPPPTAARPGDDAVFVFSSGTTGMPKAVRHTHGSVAAAVRQWRTALQLTAIDRLQIMTPPSHILGLLNILTAFDAGAWVRLHPRFDVDTMLRHIESDRITVEMAVAPIALALAAHPRLGDHDLSSLRYLMWCATPVTRSVADDVTRRTGVRWVTAYGASEVPVISCDDLADARLDTVGRPASDVEVRIVDPATRAVLGPGGDGEIEVRSPAAMAGYLPDEATADVVTQGWHRTGDIGTLDAQGRLRITDRVKDMIKVRGFQVAPAEIESVLHGHPAVRDCAVFGVPTVDGEAIVAAVRSDDPGVADALCALVADTLATYKRLSHVVLVDDIPRLPSGKVLRRVLRERAMSACAKSGGTVGRPSDQ